MAIDFVIKTVWYALFANRGIFFLHSLFWLTRLPQMQLDSFKLATKKGNTLLWIYNINHIYQNVSFIYDEIWNKSCQILGLICTYLKLDFFCKLSLFQTWQKLKSKVANSHMTLNKHDNAYFTSLKICFFIYLFSESFLLKT